MQLDRIIHNPILQTGTNQTGGFDQSLANMLVIGGILLVLLVIIFYLVSRLTKKLVGGRMKEKQERMRNADKAFNTLLAVKTISRNFESQGMDISKVKEMLDEADEAYESSNYGGAVEVAEKAKERLMEIKAERDRREEASYDKTKAIDESLFDTKDDPRYEPTAKERLQKRLPPNYAQSRFVIGMTEERLRDCQDEKAKAEAAMYLEKARSSFDAQDYDSALSYALKCKRVAEGRSEEKTAVVEEKKAMNCSRCQQQARPGDMFCRRCGLKLQEA